MNRERAETFLRVLAETELRDGLARRPDGAPRPDRHEELADLLRRPTTAALLGRLTARQRQAITLQFQVGLSEDQTAARMRISRSAVKSHTTRVLSMLRDTPEDEYTRTRRVAQVLTALGALEEEVADQVLHDGALALDARRIGIGGERIVRLVRMGLPGKLPAGTPPAGTPPAGTAPAGTAPAGPPPGSAAPRRIVPLGQLVTTVDDLVDVTTELYLLSYAETALGPQLSVFARTRVPPHRWAPTGPHFFEQFTATDDRGTSYRISLRNIGGGATGRTLMLRPDPPHAPRWLDLTTAPGRPAVRIDLDRGSPGLAETTVRPVVLGPGPYLLHTIAARVLAAAWPVSPDMPQVTALAAGPPARLAGGLGDIVGALQACGALSLLSPVPGQLAALCASLDVQGHGITARPARDLPEPWLSLLARYQRRKLRVAPAQDGCAAVTAVLPERDGIGLAVLGLHNSQDRTVLHLHASGPRSEATRGPDGLYAWAALWVRDAGGHWHATRTVGRSRMDDGVALRVEVVPPLSRAAAWIELVATGPSDEVRAALPLRWQ
jgi:DNA-binding CsgD family transcriptional regulator